jgi:hypothetical protein
MLKLKDAILDKHMLNLILNESFTCNKDEKLKIDYSYMKVPGTEKIRLPKITVKTNSKLSPRSILFSKNSKEITFITKEFNNNISNNFVFDKLDITTPSKDGTYSMKIYLFNIGDPDKESKLIMTDDIKIEVSSDNITKSFYQLVCQQSEPRNYLFLDQSKKEAILNYYEFAGKNIFVSTAYQILENCHWDLNIALSVFLK